MDECICVGMFVTFTTNYLISGLYLYRSDISSTEVTIGGVPCTVQSVSDTEIQCVTGPRPAGSIRTKVTVEISHNGIAKVTLVVFRLL
jgi:hypothetical protein